MIETLLMVALSGEVLCDVAGRRVLECYREVSHRIGERVFIQSLLIAVTLLAIVCRYWPRVTYLCRLDMERSFDCSPLWAGARPQVAAESRAFLWLPFPSKKLC